MTVQVTILGLGQIGTSIGLALSEHKNLVRRVGNDANMDVARQAEKLGAIDQIVFNLPSAVQQADLIILALPVDEIKEDFEVISKDLKEGVVIIDTSPAKTKVAEWAAELLPPETYVVGWSPTVNPNYLFENQAGIEGAHADLFKDSLIFITTPSNTVEPAIKLATDLAALVGAKPFYADIHEVDGLIAASTLLPQLSSIALLHAIIDQPGWRETRKLAGQVFSTATSPILTMEGQKNIAHSAIANRENALRVLDNMMKSLSTLRQAIDEQDEDYLRELAQAALDKRTEWVSQRKQNDWNSIEGFHQSMPTAGEVFGQLFGIRKSRAQREAKDRKK